MKFYAAIRMMFNAIYNSIISVDHFRNLSSSNKILLNTIPLNHEDNFVFIVPQMEIRNSLFSTSQQIAFNYSYQFLSDK